MPADGRLNWKNAMDILVVEDDAISRRLLKKAITAMGHQVAEAENGRQAIGIMAARPIALIVTDWLMPDMDGLALCRHVRGVDFNRYIYVIVLTAKDQKEDMVEIFQAGADDYIRKPFDREELRARIQTGARHIELEQHYQQVQHTLIASRNKLRTVFDALGEEVVSLNPDFTIVSVNKVFTDRIGGDADAIVGKGGREYFDTHVEAAVRHAFATKAKAHMLLTECADDTAVRHRQVEVLPIYGDTTQVVSVVVVMKDVTEERRKAEEIQALNDRLTHTAIQVESENKKLENALKQLETTQAQMIQSEKMASIGQLAAGVAHEINNPTGFVSSNLKTLNDYTADLFALIGKYRRCRESMQAAAASGALSPEFSAELNEITAFEKKIDIDYLTTDTTALIGDCREGTERIKKIVLDLKDFAHPGSDTLKPVDINAGLESTLNVVKNEIKYKATVHRAFGEIPRVMAFAQQLNQVFMNILVNAAQAIEKKGEIHIRTCAMNGCVEIEIRDTGCGIPEKNLSKIFDPFFTTKEVGKGTGLGMHIAYNIVKKHNGTIAVQSQVGQGTTLTVRIPVEGPAGVETETDA
jgi:two-component system, NtrC family, sensor kinase